MEIRNRKNNTFEIVENNSICIVSLSEEECWNEEEEDILYVPVVMIDHLFVAEESRKQGLGRKLLRKGIEIAHSLADKDNLPIKIIAAAEEDVISEEDLVAFYQSEGFEVVELEEGACTNNVIMELAA